MIRTVIADDEKLSLQGTARIIEKTDGFAVCGLANNGLSAFKLVVEEKPDLLITDIRMPQKDGIWLIEELEKQNLSLPVIVISAYDDQKYIKTAIRSRNVFDYLFKPFLKEDLIESIKAAVAFKQNRTPAFHKEDDILYSLVKDIKENNDTLMKEELDSYFENTTEDLHDIKNRVYGWMMHIHYDVFTSGRLLPLYTRNAMKEVYDCQNKKQLNECLFAYLKDCCERYAGDEEITAVVKECLQIVHREMNNQDLSVNYCANILNITPNYLSSRFSRDMKQNFSAYLNSLRLEKAKELLGNINLKVYEVADRIGFSDVAYFNRVFKEKYGMTPVQYRQKAIEDE